MKYKILLHNSNIRRKHTPGFLLFAGLLIFACTFIICDRLEGKTLSQILERNQESNSVTHQTHVSSDSTSSISVDILMAAIHNQPQRLAPLPPDLIDTETLWLARCIYSETKRPEEMELIAWVVRNRVETQYRGKRSYQSVVLDRYQFSAFNPQSQKRRYYSNLGIQYASSNWQSALAIAYGVRFSDTTYRPFSIQTRHFYSERSLNNQPRPEWAVGIRPVTPSRSFNIESKRFRFFEGIS